MGRFRALQSHDFRLLFFGQLVSLTGSQMQHVAVAWQLYVLTRSPVSLGLIGFFRVAPVILFGAFGGVFADALDRRKLMLLTQSSLAIASLILAVATITGEITPALMYAALFFSGAALAFEVPARQALLPELVPAEDLPNALSLYATAWQMGAIVGPAIAGFALEPLGVAAIYFIDVASFVAVIIALLAMRHRGSAREKTQISFGAALEGLRFLKRSPLIYSTMLLDFFATFFGASKQLLPIFAAELLGVGARGFGLLYAAEPAGAAVAGAVMSALPPIHRQGRVLIIAVLVYGAAMTIFGLSPWMSLSCAMLALAGASDMVSMVIRQTIRQLNTPDELRGRMTSVNMLFFMGGPQLGEVEAGFLAGALGARFSVTSGGVACIIATLAIALLIPALPRYLHKKA